MKHKIYLTYLSLIAIFLLSCQKEEVAPQTTDASDNISQRIASCQAYSYQTKTGSVQLGPAATDKILVIFNNGLTLSQKNQILRSFKKFDQISGEYLNATNDLITFVLLKPNTTCTDMEAMKQALLNNSNVALVLPTFGSIANNTKSEFYNGILVKMINTNSPVAINRLAQLSNTQIVGFPADFGPGVYYIRVDKNSNGNLFDVISFYNASTKVEFAEPDGPIFPFRTGHFNPQIALQRSAVN